MTRHKRIDQSSSLDTFPPRWSEFLNCLVNKLSKTSPELLNVRCLTKSTLAHLFESIKEEISLPPSFPSGVKILNRLTSMGIAKNIPITRPNEEKPSNTFYLIGIQGNQEIRIDPLELLQAFHSMGVICFFSAMAFMGLTTQIASHNHIAIPNTTRENDKRRIIEPAKSSRSQSEVNLRSQFGTYLFSYQDIPYYSTKRMSHTIPGQKIRILSPNSSIRITMREQTLLDTLQYPYHCGGPETVFEAWEKNTEHINLDSIMNYLKIIGIPPLTRRLGAMLELYNIPIPKKLANHLDFSRREFIKRDVFKSIPLLKGLVFSKVNNHWNVTIP